MSLFSWTTCLAIVSQSFLVNMSSSSGLSALMRASSKSWFYKLYPFSYNFFHNRSFGMFFFSFLPWEPNWPPLHTSPFDCKYEHNFEFYHSEYIILRHNLDYNAFRDPKKQMNSIILIQIALKLYLLRFLKMLIRLFHRLFFVLHKVWVKSYELQDLYCLKTSLHETNNVWLGSISNDVIKSINNKYYFCIKLTCVAFSISFWWSYRKRAGISCLGFKLLCLIQTFTVS